MRLDHIAYRVSDRKKTAQFFIDALGYRIQTEFDLKFGDGTTCDCIALEPPEKMVPPEGYVSPPWTHTLFGDDNVASQTLEDKFEATGWDIDFHLAPEIFVSDGEPNSIVGKWVAERGGIGGIHHLAYQVDDVQEKMNEWREKGYAEFASDKPLTCPGLTQVFTKPSVLTGVIYEFITRGEHGFCVENVKGLMESTVEKDT